MTKFSRCPSSRTIRSAASKLPSMAIIFAPYTKACSNFPLALFPAGKITTHETPPPPRVGGSRSRRISSRSADDRACAALHRLGHSYGHAAILKRTRRIDSFVFHENFTAAPDPLAQLRTINQRRVSLAQRNDRRRFRNRKMLAVTFNHSPTLL